MPVRNEERHLGEQLAALAAQSYEGEWEVVIVDNGSADRSIEVARSWQARLPRLRIADASDRRGINHARNVGARVAAGDYLVYCDGDDLVSPGWLAALASAANQGDIVAGALDESKLNDPTIRAWRHGGNDRAPVLYHDFMVAAPGGNCGIWAEVARAVGWDEGFEFGSSDVEFCWRAQLREYRIAFAPEAVVHVRFRSGMLSTAQQWFGYGKSGPKLYRQFRGAGMPRGNVGEAARDWAWLVRRVTDLGAGQEKRGWWLRTLGFRAGRLVGSLQCRAFLP